MQFLILIALLFLTACIPISDSKSITVKYVIDGDTFKTTKGKSVRIWGIDAPEKGEPYYQTSKAYLDNFIDDTSLQCNLIDVDKYQRDVMRCYFDEEDIGAQLVNSGLARDYTRFSNGYYEREELNAQVSKRGVWSE